MELRTGGTLDPCPPCKIILNGGFINALAPVLAFRAQSEDVSKAAVDLGTAASVYAKMLDTLGVTVKVESDWEGCDQARLLVHWIRGESGPTPDAAERMDQWTADIWSAIADLAGGKLPT